MPAKNTALYLILSLINLKRFLLKDNFKLVRNFLPMFVNSHIWINKHKANSISAKACRPEASGSAEARNLVPRNTRPALGKGTDLPK